MQKSTHERLQAFIFTMEQGKGAAVLKMASMLLGFALLAFLYNVNDYHGFASPEAMETAQLARQLAGGNGYTTDSIRPLSLGLLERADSIGAARVLQRPVPDLSIPPGYPFILACAMKVLPFHFNADPNQPWVYQPELLIVLFNEALLFVAALLVFQVARRLFDASVGWLAAIVFCGTEMYWKFGSSGLSTVWLMVVLLALVWCLLELEERERRTVLPGLGGTMALAGAAGVLAGIGGLSRYSFAWLILPVVIFVSRHGNRARGRLCLCAAAGFLVVMGPWIARNVALSNTPFGTAGYAVLENTIPPLENDRLERTFNPSVVLRGVTFHDVMAKFMVNEGELLKNDAPRFGGNWVSAFFLCGLLLPFRSLTLQRVRYFLAGSLVLMAVVQPLGQTHVSADSPEINTENLLAVLAPMVLIFGAGFFFTLLDQMTLPDPKTRGAIVGIFAFVMCGPLLLALASPPPQAAISAYTPYHIQRTAGMMKPNELMMSDIPWAVAWYGDRPCAWLTLDDDGTFKELNEFKPVQAIFLTQQTTERPFLSQIVGNQQGWGHFLLNGLPESAWPHGEVPTGFPLKNAALDYLPEQMFISDKIRWHELPK